MRTAVTLAALTLAAFGVVAGPAGLSSAEGKDAQQTINDLQAKGYTVTIDRIGTGPLSDCVVTSVRNPQQVTQWVPAVGPVLGGDSGTVLIESTISKSISVSLNCNG
jgi:hypothetical protein